MSFISNFSNFLYFSLTFQSSHSQPFCFPKLFSLFLASHCNNFPDIFCIIHYRVSEPPDNVKFNFIFALLKYPKREIYLSPSSFMYVKIPHTQGYVACNTHRSGYLKPTQPSRLGLPLALWFVRIQARCHLCSHNSTWKSFRVAAVSGHLTGTAYGQAVKP